MAPSGSESHERLGTNTTNSLCYSSWPKSVAQRRVSQETVLKDLTITEAES